MRSTRRPDSRAASGCRPPRIDPRGHSACSAARCGERMAATTKMMTGTGTGPTRPLPNQRSRRIEAEIGPPLRDGQGQAAEDGEAAERDDEGRHLQARDRLALDEAGQRADGDRRQQRGEPAIAGCRRPPSDSVLAVPPLATTAATMPQSASSEPTERSMPAVRIDEGHAERDAGR